MTEKKDKKSLIVETGLALWCENSQAATFRQIANELKIRHAGIYYYFHNATELQEEIQSLAIETNNLRFLSLMIVGNNKCVSHFSDVQKRKILNDHLTKSSS